MRTAEILVLSTQQHLLEEFRGLFGGELEVHSDNFWMLQYSVDEDYSLICYGVHLAPRAFLYDWSWIVSNALGAVYLDSAQESLLQKDAEKALSFLERRFDLPLVVALRLETDAHPPLAAHRGGLLIDDGVRFFFYRPQVPADLRQLIVGLINLNLEKVQRQSA